MVLIRLYTKYTGFFFFFLLLDLNTPHDSSHKGRCYKSHESLRSADEEHSHRIFMTIQQLRAISTTFGVTRAKGNTVTKFNQSSNTV